MTFFDLLYPVDLYFMDAGADVNVESVPWKPLAQCRQ